MQGLNADMAGPRIDMGLEALANGRLVTPGHHGVQKPITASIRQVLLAEAQALPIALVTGQGQVKRHRLPRYPSGLGGVLDQEYLLLNTEPWVRANARPRLCRMLGG